MLSFAYFTDPRRLIELIRTQSPWLIVGGDKGDASTKVGVTFLLGAVAVFLPLIAYVGDNPKTKDDNSALSALHSAGKWLFTGASTCWRHFSCVLQWLVDDCDAWVNGDWMWLNAIRGIGSPSSTWPCPFCYATRANWLELARR